MKNIHILPTDKPSRLHLWTDENGTRLELCELEYSHTRNTQHIYITSDEEIKMDDWYLDDTNSVRQAITECESYWTHRKKYQKIILTTDQDLIKDGVQAIDDEFLEWFVRNPSCESVEIQCSRYNFYAGQDLTHYKIIIPQEEPKQETLEEAAIINCESITHPYCDREKAMFIKGAKWQAERMYSEEDMAESFVACWKSNVPDGIECKLSFKEWFKQFKKK